MANFSALTEGERAILQALNTHGIRFLVVGLSAAVLQGANTGTRDIDIWFESTSDARIGDAVRSAHGIWVAGSFGMRPPQIGGDGLDDFAREYADAVEMIVDGVSLHVLPLARIVASKRASGRTKDVAVLPALEEALAALKNREGT